VRRLSSTVLVFEVRRLSSTVLVFEVVACGVGLGFEGGGGWFEWRRWRRRRVLTAVALGAAAVPDGGLVWGGGVRRQ